MRRAPAAALALALCPALAPAAAAPPDRVAFRFQDPAIAESSGLVASDGLVVTVNDSGDTSRVFAVDPATGRTVGVTTWSRDSLDNEALAPAGPGRVWVGDIGDNGADRATVTVVRVPVGPGDRRVSPTAYDLVYPDGARDAETLLAEPGSGRLLVVTKGIFGGEVFLAPRRLDPDRPRRMRPAGDVLGLATDGSFFPDGRHLIVRSYDRAAVYTWPGLREIGRWDLPDQPQGEGLAVRGDGRVLISTEGERAAVLEVTLPPRVRSAVEPGPSIGPAPSPPTPEAPPAPPTGEGRALWPWVLGGVAVVGILLLSLRPRGEAGRSPSS